MVVQELDRLLGIDASKQMRTFSRDSERFPCPSDQSNHPVLLVAGDCPIDRASSVRVLSLFPYHKPSVPKGFEKPPDILADPQQVLEVHVPPRPIGTVTG